MKIFQIDISLSETKGVCGWLETSGKTITKQNSSHIIQSIEDEGWRLVSVGYVYRITGSEERNVGNLFMDPTKKEEKVSGEIIGIYIFRAISNKVPSQTCEKAPNFLSSATIK